MACIFEPNAGSSPRVRGTPAILAMHWAAGRFIPARAGNTGPGTSIAAAMPVHPRACGEHPEYNDATMVDHGSSPRVRGTPILPPRRRSLQRFIPARAGNTANYQTNHHRPAVHPRACGEHEQFPLA